MTAAIVAAVFLSTYSKAEMQRTDAGTAPTADRSQHSPWHLSALARFPLIGFARASPWRAHLLLIGLSRQVAGLTSTQPVDNFSRDDIWGFSRETNWLHHAGTRCSAANQADETNEGNGRRLLQPVLGCMDVGDEGVGASRHGPNSFQLRAKEQGHWFHKYIYIYINNQE